MYVLNVIRSLQVSLELWTPLDELNNSKIVIKVSKESNSYK